MVFYRTGKGVKTEQNRMNSNDYERLTIEERKLLVCLLNNDKINRKKAMGILELKDTKIYEILAALIEKKLPR